MPLSWQDAAALAIAALAAAYITRLAYGALAARKAGGCGACSACPSSNDEPSVVMIQPLAPKGGDDR